VINHKKTIPNYIEATSPRGLRRLMFDTNVKAKSMHQYFDIQTHVNRRGKTLWIAWYYAEMKPQDLETLTKED